METVEEQKVTKDAIEEPAELETTIVEEDEGSQKSDDIIKALRATGHKASYCTDQMIVGVRLDGIKGKRAVHIDVVHVLDWRNSSFSGSLLAMQASVLETVNTGLAQVLEEVGYTDMLVRKDKRTTRGKVSFDTLIAHDKHSGSMVYETRTVYVVTKDIRPSTDLSWLTDNSRVVGIDQFALARQSDFRSVLPEMNRRVDGDKWAHFQRSNNSLLLGLLVLVFGAFGGLTLSIVNSTLNGNFLLPFLAMLAGIPVGIILLSMSFREIAKFLTIVEDEKERVGAIGDSEKVRKSIEDNAETFARLKDMEFAISPFMSQMGGALRIGDIKSALESTSYVFDEIVRKSVHPEDIPNEDESLGKFLGIFSRYDPEFDEDQLSLTYVTLSNYLSTPLDEPTAINYCCILLNALGRIGIIRPDVKGRIDDEINKRTMGLAVVEMEVGIADDSDSEDSIVKKMEVDMDRAPPKIPEIIAETYSEDDGDVATSEDESASIESAIVQPGDDMGDKPDTDLDEHVEESVEDTPEDGDTLGTEEPDSDEESEVVKKEVDGVLEITSADVVALKSKERADKKRSRIDITEPPATEIPIAKKKRRSKSSA